MNTAYNATSLIDELDNTNLPNQDQTPEEFREIKLARLKMMARSSYNMLKDEIPNLLEFPVCSAYYTGKLKDLIDTDPTSLPLS